MLLGATVLAQTTIGGVASGASLMFVELSAQVSSQFSIDSQIAIEGFSAGVGRSVFAAYGIPDIPKNLLIAANNGSATLAANITATATSITLTGNIADWPDSGALTLDLAISSTGSSEICYYDGKAGQVITLVERGADNTTAKAFSAGARVQLRVIAHHHNLLAQTLIDVETVVVNNTAQIETLETEVDNKADVGHTHTSDEITDLGTTFVDKSGDTMTGPLTLSGLPTAILHAATKGYVDQRIGAIYVTDYGASGSIVTTTGSIVAGTNQLTVASATSFVIGQGIYVDGAGALGDHLITSISAIAGNVFTLANNASITRVGVLVQHDDTVAIQTAFNTVVNAGGGRVLLPRGFYRCNGPLQSTNSVLNFPYVPVIGGTAVAISVEGVDPIQWGSWLGIESTAGALIQSSRVGVDANSCLFAAALWVPGVTVADLTNIVLTIGNITFRTTDNPRLGGVDLGMCGITNVKQLHVDTGVLFSAEPTYDRFAFRAGRVNAITHSELLIVRNYWYGIILSESPFAPNCMIASQCKVGFRMDFGWYPVIGQFLSWNCPCALEIRDSAYVDWALSIEAAGPGQWYSPLPGFDVYDPLEKLHGVIRYSIHVSNTGASAVISKTGATAVGFTNLRA